MVDVNISPNDNLSGQPQDSDVVPIIRSGTNVFSQKWSDIKAALIPDSTARTAAAAAQATADVAQTAADVDADVLAHAGDPNAHHVPGMGGGGLVEAEVQALINATALSALQGQVTDGQIPAAIMRDAEFTAAAVRTLLALTSSEVNDLLTGATISGQILTFTQNDGSTVNITIPTATPGAGDGVVQQGAFNADQTELVLTLDSGGTVTIDVPAALRSTGLSATAIAALPAGATNSNTEIPSVHGGILGKISISNIMAYIRSSVGLGPRLNPGPSAATVGQVPAVNAAGDGYTHVITELVPSPAENGEFLIGHDGGWIAQLTTAQFPHVTELPVAVDGGPEFLYLDHTYALGGNRVDADIQFARVEHFTGYSDPRLGTAVGSLSERGPIVRIVVEADNTGLITRYSLIQFVDEESANRYDEIALGPVGNVPLYPLGDPYENGLVWERPFDLLNQPSGHRLDTEYKINLGREVDATFFYNDGTGLVFRNGFYELIEIASGEFIYDAISSLRRVHTSGVGPPATPPVRTGEIYTDDIGRNYTGLVEVIEVDASGSGTPVVFAHNLYDRDPLGLQEVLNLGAGGFWWTRELGPGLFNQFETAILASLVRHKSWYSTWEIIAGLATSGTNAHTLAVALRDSSVMLGGYNNHTSALDDASLQVPQSAFDAGTRIFYGLTTGGNPTRGLYELTSYSQARIIRTRVGVWVGPLATEQRAVELIEAHEFVKPVANEAAAIADGDRTGVLYLWN